MSQRTKAIVEPVWKPARRSQGGTIYCSPSCGFKCTRAAYDRANLEAVKLCSALGKGWVPEVWENCGWHFKASKGVASVHATLNGSPLDGNYTVVGHTLYFNSIKQILQSGKASVPPAELVRIATRHAKRIAARLVADAEALVA